MGGNANMDVRVAGGVPQHDREIMAVGEAPSSLGLQAWIVRIAEG